MEDRRGRVTDGPPLTDKQLDALFAVERQLTAAIEELAASLRASALNRVPNYNDEVRLALAAIAELREAAEGLCRLETLMARRGSNDVWPLSWQAVGDGLEMSKQRLNKRYRPFVRAPHVTALVRELTSRSRRMHRLAGTLNDTITVGRPRHRSEVAEKDRQYELRQQELRAQGRPDKYVPDPEDESDPLNQAVIADLRAHGLLHESDEWDEWDEWDEDEEDEEERNLRIPPHDDDQAPDDHAAAPPHPSTADATAAHAATSNLPPHRHYTAPPESDQLRDFLERVNARPATDTTDPPPPEHIPGLA